MCDKFHIKLNIGVRPIANKYCEGKMKRTLERELKVSEIAGREAIETFVSLGCRWGPVVISLSISVIGFGSLCYCCCPLRSLEVGQHQWSPDYSPLGR